MVARKVNEKSDRKRRTLSTFSPGSTQGDSQTLARLEIAHPSRHCVNSSNPSGLSPSEPDPHIIVALQDTSLAPSHLYQRRLDLSQQTSPNQKQRARLSWTYTVGCHIHITTLGEIFASTYHDPPPRQ